MKNLTFTLAVINNEGNELEILVAVPMNGTPADIEILEGDEEITEEQLLVECIDEITEFMLAATGR